MLTILKENHNVINVMDLELVEIEELCKELENNNLDANVFDSITQPVESSNTMFCNNPLVLFEFKQGESFLRCNELNHNHCLDILKIFLSFVTYSSLNNKLEKNYIQSLPDIVEHIYKNT